MFKSPLIDFEFTNDSCFICGKPATTVEHVIPKWILKKFNLWDTKVILPNKTTITYKKLTVPACKKCNNEIYGKLENKVRRNQADDKDIWRWANKIHFGLLFKDKFLDFDRKKSVKKIGDIFDDKDYLEQSRHFLYCITDEFICFPNPFGSVFKFELEEEQEFDLIHLIKYNSLYICTGKMVYIVFIRDGQIMKMDNLAIKDYYDRINTADVKLQDTLFFYANCLYHMDRYVYTNHIAFHEKGITKLSSTLREEKPENKELFKRLCKLCRITWQES